MFLLLTINKHSISQKLNEFSSEKVNTFFINLDIFVITSAIRKKWNDIAFTSTYIELVMKLCNIVEKGLRNIKLTINNVARA